MSIDNLIILVDIHTYEDSVYFTGIIESMLPLNLENFEFIKISTAIGVL
jgi:hypothetical protein